MLLQTISFYPEIKEKITHLILFGSICNISRITKDKIKNAFEHSACNWDAFTSTSPSSNTNSLTFLKVNINSFSVVNKTQVSGPNKQVDLIVSLTLEICVSN